MKWRYEFVMDISPKYIRMCSKAKELQEFAFIRRENLRPSFIWDEILKCVCIYMWFPKTLREKCGLIGESHIVSIERKNEKFVYVTEETMGKVIWLPRQDQLHDIIMDKNGNLEWYRVFDAFNNWYIERCNVTIDKSFEQAWLCFVMETQYNKWWNGENWTPFMGVNKEEKI